ncbi:MAG: glycosyltransferase family 2 protein [Candidatus Omnitrophica bacterium]|nr:glycosyltransferase family 2 protein [Candidatus Omnitrophota bacterium]
MGLKSLSVFVPVYNEESIIDKNLGIILSILEKIVDDFEILIINDGSTDCSGEKIREWSKKSQRIRFLEHKTRLGYGAALRSGFLNAGKELIFYTDMDLPADLNNLKEVMPLMDSYDLVIGYRTDRQDTLRRMIYSKVYKFLLKLLFGLKIKDINFSFKCVRRKVIEKVKLTAKTGFIDGELLIESLSGGFVVKEVPIIYRPRKFGNSHFDSLGVAINTAGEILLYWLAKIVHKKRLRPCR